MDCIKFTKHAKWVFVNSQLIKLLERTIIVAKCVWLINESYMPNSSIVCMQIYLLPFVKMCAILTTQ